MTRRLCIVSRESSALLGYLMVALRREPSGSDDLEFIVDRRHAAARPAHGAERRHGSGTDRVLTTHGYAIVEASVAEREAREAPAARTRSARSRRAPESRPARDLRPEPEYVDLEAPGVEDDARRAPSRRSRTVGIVALGGLGLLVLAAGLAWQIAGGGTSRSRNVTPAPSPDVAATRRAPDPVPATPPPLVPPGAQITPPSPPAPAVERRGAEPTGSSELERSPAFAGLPRVNLASQPIGTGAARVISYTAQLRDPDNRPLVGADVSVHGTMREGGALTARLEPTGTPGTYRGRATVGRRTPSDVRVRVMVGGTRFEVPVSR